MEEGQVVSAGSPREVFRQVEKLREMHLGVPQVTELAYALHQHDVTFPADLLTVDEMENEVLRRVNLKGVVA
jgi:hypothetical protein